MTTQATTGNALADRILAAKADAEDRVYSMAQVWNMDPVNLNYAVAMGGYPVPVDGDAMARRAALARQAAQALNTAWARATPQPAELQDTITAHGAARADYRQENTK